MNNPQLPNKNYLSQNEINQAIKEVDSFTIDIPAKYSLRDLISEAKHFNKIVVVGNQRSGTTFAAQLLSEELKYKYIDEDAFAINNEIQFCENLSYNSVAQSPSLTHKIHNLVSDDTLVIFMVRKWSDILKSIYKKNKFLSDHIFMKTIYDYRQAYWAINEPLAVKYFNLHIDKDSYFLNEVYAMWKYYQSFRLKNVINVNYESLKDSKFWVNKENRENFTPKTTGIYS